MHIHWYPGHMHKARKEINKLLPQVDLVIEVLDARVPFTSLSPLLSKLPDNKPKLYLLTKADLADPKTSKAWLDHLQQEQQVAAYAVVNGKPELKKQVLKWSQALAPKRGSIIKPLRIMIAGIPNVGKSTLINLLTGRKIAKTGDEPAVTKAQQKVQVAEGVQVFDTPGVLWPTPKSELSGYRLAASGAIRDTAIEYPDIARFLLDYLQQAYPGALAKRYRLADDQQEVMSLMAEIAAKRGCLVKGGGMDEGKVGEMIVREFRQGLLGAISLEHPEQEFAYRLLPTQDVNHPDAPPTE